MASNQDLEERLKAALSDRYRIERELGSGGMATVYLAEDLKHHRKVAIKVLKPEVAQAVGAERFLREIEIAGNLLHPHVLPVFDSGEADGFLYYVMPRVRGGSLRDRLEEEKQLPVDEAVTIAREIADALAHAHERDIVHRDVKPGNILLTGGHALLTDFGVAQAMAGAGENRLTQTGVSLGTPAYMSPEQAAGEKELDGRSDQYALGCVLYEMLAGQPPFGGPTADSVARQHLTADPPRIDIIRPSVQPVVSQALNRSLAKTPADRFRTIAEFSEALWADPPDHGARPTRIGSPATRRVRTAVAVIGVVVVMAFAAQRILTPVADPGPPSPDRPYTVLAAVEGSADHEMSETIEFLLRNALDAAHVVQTVPGPQIRRLLTLMERPDTQLLTPAIAREFAERAGVNTIVLPRADAVGDGFLIAARVEEAMTGHLLAEATGQAAGPDQVVATVQAVSLDLRRGLGETRAALANSDPLPLVFTASLEALHKYREGMALHVNFQPGRAIPLLREALATDPEFSEAYSGLARAYHNFGDPDSYLENLRLALEHPERLTEYSRKHATARLQYESDFALWDESLFRAAPSGNLNASVLSDLQHFDSAFSLVKADIRERERQHRRFEPDRPFSTGQLPVLRNLTRLAITTGRLEESEAFMDSLRIEMAEFSELNLALAASAWTRADSIRLSVPAASWESHVAKRIAIGALDVVRGRVHKGYDDYASIHSQRVIPERARLLLEVVFGLEGTDPPASLDDRGRKTVDRYVVHGVRSAILGDTLEAMRVAARMALARDSATSDMFEEAFHPMFALWDAGIAGQRGDWAEVMRLLEPCAARIGEGGYGYNTDRFLVRWVLAEAYVQIGETELAIQQFDALLLERSMEPLNVLVYAPTHFKLGQLQTEVGDTERALEHYTAFLDAFTDPDPEHEWMVEEARSAVDSM